MNDDEFEDKLRVLAAGLARPDPTPAWKAEILACARREAGLRTPRWLLTCLSMAWVCIVILRVTTPDTGGNLRAAAAVDLRVEASSNAHDAPDTPLRALIALQLNPEFPDLP